MENKETFTKEKCTKSGYEHREQEVSWKFPVLIKELFRKMEEKTKIGQFW